MRRHTWRLLMIATALMVAIAVRAETVTVAVASNFSVPLTLLGADFEATTGHELRLVTGSTGRLYSQIVNGAPYDVFLAADADRPGQLEADDRIVPNSRFTYAEGILVLWSADPALSADGCLAALDSVDSGRIAIANPVLAPYGRAARDFLEHRGAWAEIEGSLVTGESVAQVAQFVATRNAKLGFIAKSQIITSLSGEAGCMFEVPADSHAPIKQQAVQLTASRENVAAAAFIEFLKSDAVRQELVLLGYRAQGFEQ